MNALLKSLARGVRDLWSRHIYIATMLVIPLGCAFFFTSLMGEGLPLKVPAAVVDLDDSSLSRRLTQNLGSTELIDVKYRLDNIAEAEALTREGKIYGFFLIPTEFQKDAIGGRGPTLSFYSNMTFFVPGTLAFKGFKTMAVTTSGSIVKTTLVSKGVSEAQAGELLQPVVVQEHPLGNPWTNYSIYLSNSFAPGVVALMILLVTAFSVCNEIKRGTSIEWLKTADGSMLIALTGKLLPQTVIFTLVGWVIQAWFFGFLHFPLNCPLWHMLLAMFMMVIATQALGVLICCAVPNLRIALSIASLIGILSFSIAGLSYPVANMYGAIAIFSYIIPLRFYFLIYADQALNGVALFYSKYWYAALAAFIFVAFPLMGRLKKHCLNPVYVP